MSSLPKEEGVHLEKAAIFSRLPLEVPGTRHKKT
jgi:hypothetical protein